jgi:predicted phosphate transport protein (TIGR00153 family)
MNLFYKSPFENLIKHAEKVRSCSLLFMEAMECYLDGRFERFEAITDLVAKMESEADAIKRNIRGHMPRGVLMPVDKFQFFLYLREQDSVLDAVEEALYWLSNRHEPVHGEIKEDLKFFTSSVLPTMDKLLTLVEMAGSFFRRGSEEERNAIKSLIRDVRQLEHEADHLERELKKKIFAELENPIDVFHLIRLVEVIGSIADHAQNATDMMRAMIAR